LSNGATQSQQTSNTKSQLPLYKHQLPQDKHCLNNPNGLYDGRTCREWSDSYERDKRNNQLQKSLTWIEIPDKIEVDNHFNVDSFMSTFEDDMLTKCSGGRQYGGIEYDLKYTCKDRKQLLYDVKRALQAEVIKEANKTRKALKEKRKKEQLEKLANKKKKKQLEKERVEKQAKLDSSLVVLTPNGRVSGYKELKFGITKAMAKSILKNNCNGDVRDEGGIFIEGSSCFDIMNKKVSTVRVAFNNEKLALVSLDFNGNILNPLLQYFFQLHLFDSGSFKTIKENIGSQYELTEVNNTFNEFKVLSYEHGAMVLIHKYKWDSELGKWVTYLALDYNDTDLAKEILKTYRLGKGNQDEF
jgi:hypothetical protein